MKKRISIKKAKRYDRAFESAVETVQSQLGCSKKHADMLVVVAIYLGNQS